MSSSTLINEFQSIKNKALVWKFMMENNFFEGIDINFSNDIKLYFENKIQQISNVIAPTDSLVILNKQVLSEMMTNNLKYKGKQAKQNQAQVQAQQPSPLITTGDITEQRQKVFNKVLENKQSEFNSLMNRNIPDKIDFSDNADKPIGSEMDKMIAETIAWREKELNIVLKTQDQTEASKWINRDQTNITPQNNIKVSTKNLKIGSSTTLDNIVDLKKSTTPEKKVSFNFTNTDSDTSNFLSMLKTTNDRDNVSDNVSQEIKDIKIILDEVVSTQKLIMSLLQKIDINNNNNINTTQQVECIPK